MDFSYNGVAKNSHGWWCIHNGKVDFSYTGVETNENGAWYCVNGQVRFDYSGTIQWMGTSLPVINGKIGSIGTDVNMYVKAQAAGSGTNWLILVDCSACKVGVFRGSKGSWTAVKYIPCSPGTSSTPTVKGTFKVSGRGKSFGTSSYTCWYYTQFYGNYLFHSVLYYPGSMTKVKDGRLGMRLSHGCVRLAIENAKWIYDNIPSGTTVIIY